MRHYRILGVDIVDQTMSEAVADVQGLVASTGPRSLFFANAHTLNNVAEDPSYGAVLNRASRVYGDGTGVRWAARLRGLRLSANLNGTDLIPIVFETVPGLRCFLLGSKPAQVQNILASARRRFPDVQFVGAHHGYLDPKTTASVVSEINRSRANIVLVAMGNPLQERWIDENGGSIPDALLVGVGGLLEYWSGDLKRAPVWMRNRGIEWLYRVVAQPGRRTRYLLGNPLYLVRVTAALQADRAAGRTPPTSSHG